MCAAELLFGTRFAYLIVIHPHCFSDRDLSMSSKSQAAVYAAIAGNVALAIIKGIAAIVTGSAAMLSESMHSLVDTGNGGLLLLGMHLSRRPADENHPFGHGLELYFWSLVVAILVFAVGGGMSAYEGILHLLHPREITNYVWVYSVLVCGLAFEGTSFYFALQAFIPSMRGRGVWETIHTTKDPTVFAVFLEDAAALLGLLVAIVGVSMTHLTGNFYFDGLASLAIGLLLMVVASILAWESRMLLIGEGADSPIVNDIHSLVVADKAVLNAKRPLTLYFGPENLLVNLDVQFEPQLSALEMEVAVDRLEKEIRERYPEVSRIYIEMDSIRTESSATLTS